MFLPVALLILLLITAIYFRTRSYYKYPDANPADPTAYNTYDTDVQTCELTYALAMVETTDDQVATTTRDTCIDLATTAYVTARCPPLVGDHSGSAGYKTQLDTDVLNIKKAYTYLIEHPDQYDIVQGVTALSLNIPKADVTLSEIALDLLNRAMNADIACASRKYLASACPDFYTTATVAAAASTIYTSVTFPEIIVSGTPTPTQMVLSLATQCIVDNIVPWSEYAGSVTYTGSTDTIDVSLTGTYTVMPLRESGSNFLLTGGYDASAVTTNELGQPLENWGIARAYGPLSMYILGEQIGWGSAMPLPRLA